MSVELFPTTIKSFENSDAASAGDAGEWLVMAHLATLGYEHGLVQGRHIDVIVFIDGRPRCIQVKSSFRQKSFGGDGRIGERNQVTRRGLLSYKGEVDAFAFCCLLHPYPYYMAAEAVSKNIESFSDACFTRRGRDSSFEELLRRWRGEKAGME